MRSSLVLMLAAAAACSGGGGNQDACAAAQTGFAMKAVRGTGGATLTWNAVSGASKYEIWAFLTNDGGDGNVFQNPVDTASDVTDNLGWSDSLGPLKLEIHPILQGATCKAAAGSLVVPLQPVLTAQITETGVQLNWSGDPLLSDASTLVGRAEGNDDVETLATATGSAFFDSTVLDETSYTYAVRMTGPNLAAFSPFVSIDTLLPAPVVSSITDTANGVLITVTPPTGANTCFETHSNQQLNANTLLAACGADRTCTYSIVCFDARNHHSHPASASGHLAPGAPGPCTAVSASGGVQLFWSAPQSNLGSYVISRTVPGRAAQTLSTAATGSIFVDSASPLFELATYSILAVAPDGVFDPASVCTTEKAMGLSPSSAANLTASAGFYSPAQVPGQNFTVQTAGQLMGIEVLPFSGQSGGTPCLQVSPTTDPQAVPALTGNLACAAITAQGFGPSLLDDSLNGLYFDVSPQNLAVSAGETLHFEILDGSFLYAFSTDKVPGSATVFSGSRDELHDLVFKAYVLPNADATPPKLTAIGSGANAVLQWTATPAAHGYDVLDASSAVLLHTADTHAVVPLAAGGSSLRVRAVTSLANPPISNVVTVSPQPIITVAQNLCDATPFSSLAPGTVITQSFVATADGVLSRIDLDVQLLENARMDVLDATSGLVIATGVMSAAQHVPTLYAFPALSASLPGAQSVDLSASGGHVTAGQSLILRLLDVAGGTQFVTRFVPDTYAQGTAGQDMDLCFKVYAQTN